MMAKKMWLTALVGAVFAGGGLGLVIWNESRTSQVDDTVIEPGDFYLMNETPGVFYTMSEVAAHGDSESCWTVIEGKVYDLTPYIEEHPGGSKAILAICGGDGTGSFTSMPATVMTMARMMLAKHKIGTFSE